MRPYPEEVLRAIQTGIGAHFMPEVKSDYAKAQFAFTMLLFTIVQRDFDGVAQDLVDANAALRTLIGKLDAGLVSVTGAGAVREQIAALAPSATSVRLSDLRREHDALRAVIASAAPLIEPAGDDDALAALRAVRAEIYAHLQSDARRRMVPILGN